MFCDVNRVVNCQRTFNFYLKRKKSEVEFVNGKKLNLQMSYPQAIEEMDISESSNSSQENINECQVLRLAKPITADILNNEVLDNEKFTDNNTYITGTTSTKATNFHPLMLSPNSPRSPDYPDLIPEKPKSKISNYDVHFNPAAHSTAVEGESQVSKELLEKDLIDYSEELPDFPDSPTALKKLCLYEFPVEIPVNDVTSDNENDKSIYEAHLSPNFQNVSLTMNEKEGNLNFLSHNKQSNKLRKIKVIHTETSQDSDISSLDSLSESLKSEDVYAEKTDAEGKMGNHDEETTTPEPIEPLSAADERRHARYWQRMLLPGGEQRTIDMRVIEPYKRVLSHGGYMRAGGQTAIVLFSACSLPDKSRVDYDYVMDNLFLYILWTLERLVTEDYVLVYLHSGATRLPSFGWMKRCYQLVGRKLRKNLSNLYIVHPTFLIKTMLFMAKPFISSKFYRKIVFVGSLRDLLIRVPLEVAAIPDKVKAFDSLRNSA